MERQPRRRRRPALSCLECRRRKIKCDRNDPCAHCVTARIQCIYRTYSTGTVIQQQYVQGSSLSSTPSPAPYVPSPLSQPQHISANRLASEHADQAAVSRQAAAVSARQDGSRHAFGFVQRPNKVQSTEPSLHDVLQRIQRLEESSRSTSTHVPSETSRDMLEHHAQLQESPLVMNKTRMMAWSRWIGTMQEFETLMSCYTEYIEVDGDGNGTSFQDPESQALATQIRDLLKKSKDIARNIKIGRPSRSLSSQEFGLVPPSREVADIMTTQYFQSFESTHRILHAPTFWAEYEKFWNYPNEARPNLRLKVLLVIGIGSSLSENPDVRLQNTIHQWIYAAQTWLSGPLEKDRLDINGLQIHCLTMLARQIFSIGGDLVWMSMGSLVHRAMQIGFHRDPKHLPKISVLQAELRRRLWATILEMVVQSSLDSGMPARISFDEFDTEAPSNINDEDINESSTILQPYPRNIYTATSIQLLLLDSLPIRLRIVQLLNGLHSEVSYQDVLALSSEITEKHRTYSSFMKENEESGITAFQRNMLRYLVRRFIIPLHFPFSTQARSNPLFYYSLKVSLDTAMAIISPEPDEAFSNIMATGGGLFRQGFRTAYTIIILELITEVETQHLDGTLHHYSQHRERLKQIVKDMISSSAERIRRGETNIKSHMYLSMTIAQVEAIEAGTEPKFKMAQSARDSLEYCHGLLQTRLDSLSLGYPNDMCIASTSPYYGLDSYGLDLDLEFFLPDVGFP